MVSAEPLVTAGHVWVTTASLTVMACWCCTWAGLGLLHAGLGLAARGWLRRAAVKGA
jgi:hypothetical protein